MSRLRFACTYCTDPEHPRHPHAFLVDVGHGSALGYHHDGGRLAVPEPTKYRADTTAADRVRRFRAKEVEA